MIIIVCTDDPQLEKIAQKSIKKYPGVFGDYYKVFDEDIPVLDANEDLFIIAHGAFEGDDGNPVIGDKSVERAFYLNALGLLQNIGNIFPAFYSGDIYVDACESADHNDYTFSFIEVLQAQIQTRYDSNVYGKNGSPSGLIDPPGGTWTRAGWGFDDGFDDGAGGSGSSSKPVITPLPAPNQYNVQAKKYYVFNETGNIMMASTSEQSETIKKSVRDVFAEVSVFFAAMTKAISTTVNPNATNPEGAFYSLYDYQALSNVIDGSGLFVHVTEEDINYYTESVGIELVKN